MTGFMHLNLENTSQKAEKDREYLVHYLILEFQSDDRARSIAWECYWPLQ